MAAVDQWALGRRNPSIKRGSLNLGERGSQAKEQRHFLSRRNLGPAVKDTKDVFHHILIPYVVYMRVYNTGKFNGLFHSCGTYYKVGELAHTLKCV